MPYLVDFIQTSLQLSTRSPQFDKLYHQAPWRRPRGWHQLAIEGQRLMLRMWQ